MKSTENQISSFVPRLLSSSEWTLAGDAVRRAVRDAAPRDAGQAKSLMSRVCAFLAASSVWDRTDAPDLGALLTVDAIQAFCDRHVLQGGKASTARVYRTDLRRIATVASGLPLIPISQSAVRRPRRLADTRLVTLVNAGYPLIKVAAAWRELAGCNLGEHRLGAVVCSLRALTRPAALSFLADAGERSFAGGRPVTADRAASKSKPDKPMSLAARRRYAAERIAEAKRLTAGPRIVTEAPQISSDVAAYLAAYRPQGVDPAAWALIRDAWVRLAAGYRPVGDRHASHIARHIADFLLWFLTHPIREDRSVPVALAELVKPRLVEAWIDSRSNPDSSKITMRSTVNRALRSLDPDPNRRKIAYQPKAAPYSEQECERLRSIADTQPTPVGQKNASFVVGLSAGAGLDGRDLRSLMRRHIHPETLPDGREVLVVDVPGPRQRTVAVRGYFAASVQAACDLHDDLIGDPDALVIGKKLDRTNVTTPVTLRTVTAVDGEKVDFDVNRLRSAWMVAMMCAAVPLNVLLDAAGVKTARPIVDLLPYCPKVPREEVLKILDAAGLSESPRS